MKFYFSERCVLGYWKTSTSEVGVRLKSVSRSGSVRNFWKLAQNESITVGLRRFALFPVGLCELS